MRRILLGGLALASGMFASSALGQDSRTTPQPQRSAKLGRPIAATEAAPFGDPGITPAGLLTARPGEIPVPSPMPPAGGVPTAAPRGGTPMPVGVPTGGMPMGVPTGGMPMGTPMMSSPVPTTRIIPGSTGMPSIIEDRGTGTAPMQPGTLGTPSPIQTNPGMVPSVGPGETIIVPPGMEGMMYGEGYPVEGEPIMGEGAMGRVAGMGRWYVGAEYLMWWTQAANVPVLVTTSSPQFSGRLGVGNTIPLVSGPFGQTYHSGARFTLGRWFGDNQIRGVEARGFFLGQSGSSTTLTTAMIPFLARPFNNVNPNTPFFGSDSEIIADSARAVGGVQVNLQNQVWGGEINYRRNLLGGDPCGTRCADPCGELGGVACCNPCRVCRLDAIVGYRYLNMNESLSITETFTTLPGGAAGMPLASGMVTDSFRTINQFNGGQIGLVGTLQRGRWSLDGRAAVAFGVTNRTLEIAGAQNLVMTNGQVVTANGGLLAITGANAGRYNDSIFSVVPEVGLNLGYQVTSRLKVFVGYNFLYWGNVLRPGEAIDTNVDAARIPNFLVPAGTPIAGVPRPAPQFRSSGFAVQGISFGLQFNW